MQARCLSEGYGAMSPSVLNASCRYARLVDDTMRLLDPFLDEAQRNRNHAYGLDGGGGGGTGGTGRLGGFVDLGAFSE